MMDYEEEEQEEQAIPQAIEVDANDAPFIDLQGDQERQAYAILKN